MDDLIKQSVSAGKKEDGGPFGPVPFPISSLCLFLRV